MKLSGKCFLLYANQKKNIFKKKLIYYTKQEIKRQLCLPICEMNVFCVPCSPKKTNFVMSIKKIYNLISYPLAGQKKVRRQCMKSAWQKLLELRHWTNDAFIGWLVYEWSFPSWSVIEWNLKCVKCSIPNITCQNSTTHFTAIKSNWKITPKK